MPNVIGGSREVVVDADDVMPVAEESVAEVRTEEPRGAGDDDLHAIALRPIE
jgi:hypothetical protein